MIRHCADWTDPKNRHRGTIWLAPAAQQNTAQKAKHCGGNAQLHGCGKPTPRRTSLATYLHKDAGASLKQMTTAGSGGYGLGVQVSNRSGMPLIVHEGSIEGIRAAVNCFVSDPRRYSTAGPFGTDQSTSAIP